VTKDMKTNFDPPGFGAPLAESVNLKKLFTSYLVFDLIIAAFSSLKLVGFD
jgi:hypothetical protein